MGGVAITIGTGVLDKGGGGERRAAHAARVAAVGAPQGAAQGAT